MIVSSRPILVLFALAILTACEHSTTVESRRKERWSAYAGLSPEIRQMVDQGQIRVGMSTDAVYISWGPASEVLESETAEGHLVTWQYYGSYLEDTRFWNYRETSRDGVVFLDRYMDHSYDPKDYVRAEITFKDGAVKSWRTLPRPH